MSSILDRASPPFDARIRYGNDPNQFAELRFPNGRGPFPLLFVVHGGFWQSVYDLSHIGHLCAGWPGTFQDIALATRRILQDLANDSRFYQAQTAIIGHSAGGHLALWLVGSHRISKGSPLYNDQKQEIRCAISLAGVSDLRAAWRKNLGHGTVTRLMGGTPDEHPDRYESGSPIELLPTGARHVIVHGTADDTVPFSQSEAFVEEAEKLGDQPTLVKLDGLGHYELIDPESEAWPPVARAVLSLLDLDRR